MKKILIPLAFILLILLSKTAFCQAIIDTPITNFVKQPQTYLVSSIKGRVVGLNVEMLQGVIITNKRTGDKTNSDNNGIYQLNVAKGDTIIFEFLNHSKEMRVIKHLQENLNVVMIKKKADEMPPNASPSDLRKAEKADDELYRILEKDAKLEGKWNY
jgi:hypothetical protein